MPQETDLLNELRQARVILEHAQARIGMFVVTPEVEEAQRIMFDAMLRIDSHVWVILKGVTR